MTESHRHSQAVIDLFPWATGLGFEKAETWWSYVLSQSESDRLDLLMSMALLSQELGVLLLKHDQRLLERFAFSAQTSALLGEIEAGTLEEFAQALILKQSARVDN